MKMPRWPKLRWHIFSDRFSFWDLICLVPVADHLFAAEWPAAIVWAIIWLGIGAAIERPWRPLNLRPFRPDDPEPDA